MNRFAALSALAALSTCLSCEDDVDLGGTNASGHSGGSGGNGSGAGNSGNGSGAVGGSGIGGSAGGSSGDGNEGGDGATGMTGGTGMGGSAGSPPTGGTDGAGESGGGAGPECEGVATTCPANCAALPLVSGSCDDRVHSFLCTAPASSVSFGCGVRLDDGEVFLVDAPPPVAGMRSLNVFESLPGFRSCFQSELDAIICDEPDPPSVVNVRFEISNNTSGPVWVVHEGNFCTPFEVRRLPDLTQLILSPVAQSSTCSCFQGDPTHSGKIVRLERGSTLTISWTGYELENYAALVACPTDTWACPYGYRPLSAAAGRYQAAFGAIRDAQNIYVVACETNGFCGYAGGFTWPNSCIRGLVGSDEIARPTVEFDLPETGDVVVPVSID